MREILTRYGRHNIGFAWLFGEPMLFTVGVMALWSLFHDVGAAHHISAPAFALTGYSTVLLWRNTIGRCTLAVQPNTALLYHRFVRGTDLFLARIILEVAGATMSLVVLMLFFMTLGVIPAPHDVLTMLFGWGLLAWYSAAMGMLIGGLSECSELIERLWHPVAYFQLPISGAMAFAEWLPERLRNVIMYFPVPNCVELFREGYFGDTFTPHYDIPYTVTVIVILTWLGLVMMRYVSKRVEPE
ncbi:ABC transporter permease [Paraburkholderia strydomiana]